MAVKSSKPHFHVTAGLLWLDGKVLIAKRPEGSHLAGFWEFPGGKQEMGETLKRCLEREIREELGADVRAEKLLLTVDHEYRSRIISLHLFLCDHLGGELQPLGCEEMRWVCPKDLTQYRFPPPDERIIQFLNKK